MQPIKYGKLLLLAAVLFQQSFAATYTVSQTGTPDFKTIQAAVDKASVNDEIVIIDAAVYKEQVTIDSTKHGLWLHSKDIYALTKPTIEFQDTKNVNPKTAEEATKDATINFDRNGALQILGAKRVRIEGIAVSGSAPHTFGYDGIWDDGKGQKWPLQHGNGGISLWIAGDCIIRYCDISNSFFGINVKDRNIGGVFANINPADIDSLKNIPFSGFAKTGNHIFEYNRIHNNSFGMYFESSWDLGSTIRNNLFYENHHPTTAFAEKVAGLTNEGSNMPGGAIMTKDNLLSPLAIYNNTFWHNLFIFVGVWKAGGQHLIFNNIYAEPYVYLSKDETFGGKGHLDMFKSYANRMHNCVIAAQVQAPTANYISITNDISSTPAIKAEGDVINKPFPASAEIIYLEMGKHFLSTTPSSANFLEPDWSNALVEKYIVDQGWAASGVKDPDGSPADLGAIPSGGGRTVGITTVRPTAPVTVVNGVATVNISIEARIDEIKNPVFKLTGIVRNLDTSDVFGSAYKAIATTNIQNVPVTSTTALKEGSNKITVTVPASLGDFAFLEFIVEGTDSDGEPYTSAVGFIPYRYFPYILKVTIQDAGKTKKLTEVQAGTPVNLHVEPQKLDGTVVSGILSPLALSLGSNFDLYDLSGKKIDTLISTKSGALDIPAVFHIVPAGNTDNVKAAGQIGDQSFVGSSDDIKILAGDPDSVKWIQPRSKQYDTVTTGAAKEALAKVYDVYGNLIKDIEVDVHAISTQTDIGNLLPSDKKTTLVTGVVQFAAVVTKGDKGDIFPIVASLPSNGKTDTAYMVVGEARDVFRIFYGDTAAYDSTRELRGRSGVRYPVVIRAVKAGTGVLAPDKDNAFTIATSVGIAVYADQTGSTPITSSKLTNGEVRIWIQGTLKNVTNGSIAALQSGNVNGGERKQIYFESYGNSVSAATYYADNGIGSVTRLEVFYLDTLNADLVPDSFDLYWPVKDPANKVVVKKDAVILDPADAKHITLMIVPPFTPGTTRILGNGQLGQSYWKNPSLSADAPVVIDQFAIADGVGPLIASAILKERLDDGDDTIMVAFTENVLPEVVNGITFNFKANGSDVVVPMTVKSALPGASGTIVKVVVSMNPSPKKDDSLSIIATGTIVDAAGNHAHVDNRYVAIGIQPVPADIAGAVFLDRDADGNVDVVRIAFKKSVDPAQTAIQLKWDGIQQVVPDFTGASFTMIGTDTVEIAIDNSTFGYNKKLYATSGSIEITARFLLFTTDNTRLGSARDGAAPVIQEIEYHKGMYLDDGTTADDTLYVKYTEELAGGLPNPSLKQPIEFSHNGVNAFITYSSTIGMTQNSFHRFLVPKTVDTPIPFDGDTAWINVKADAADNAKDVVENIQANPENRRVPIKVVAPMFKLDVKAGPKPFDPNLGKVTIRMKPKTTEAKEASFKVTLAIYDKVGNVVVAYPKDPLPNIKVENGFIVANDSLKIEWDGRNSNGRIVGSGTYLCFIRGTVSTRDGTVPVDESVGKILIGVQAVK